MAPADTTATTKRDTAPAQGDEWRLRYMVGDLAHYREWMSDFPTVENYYEQYRRGDYAHDVAIERRAVIKGWPATRHWSTTAGERLVATT